MVSKPQNNALIAAANGRFRRQKWFVPEDFPSLVLGAILITCFIGQWFLPGGPNGLALSKTALMEGHWYVIFSHMFVHNGLAHLLFNVSAAAALAPVVWAGLPRQWRGTAFTTLYLLCGLAGALTYLAFHWTDGQPAVGASGAICGLWGAGARLVPDFSLKPVFTRTVWENLKSFAFMNLVVIVLFGIPASLAAGRFTVAIAWEAHLGGFLAGLLLVGLFANRQPQSVTAV
ncbi:MAG: rhomboid family intramembrane serine protease [Caulobacteraceae bacterium]